MPRLPRRRSHSAAISVSNMSRGGTLAPPPGRTTSVGSGNARVSILPVAVSGNDGTQTIAAGIIASGRIRRSSRFTPSGGGRAGSSGTSHATMRRVSLVAPRRATVAAATPVSEVSAASTSGSSTRCPRIFTCRSLRPANTIAPSARQRARSPLRYARAPAPSNGCATKRASSSGAAPR